MDIQNINLGAPVTGAGGDTYREANTKINSNFDIISDNSAIVQEQIGSVAGGSKAYLTYALMLENKVNIPNDSSVVIINDPDASKNGSYLYDGISFTKSPYDSLALAKTYTNSKTDIIKDFTRNDEYALSITDNFNRVAVGLETDGTLRIDNSNIKNLSTNKLEMGDNLTTINPNYALTISDSLNNLALALNNDGILETKYIKTDILKVNGINILDLINSSNGGATDNPTDNEVTIKPLPLIGNFPSNLLHYEIYGQSLAVGARALPLQTLTQKYDSLMFTGGMRVQHPAYNVPNFYADFIPQIEAGSIDGYTGNETPSSGANEAIKQLIASENGISYTQQDYKLLGSTSGEGGQTIAQLLTLAQTNLLPTITAAYNLAQSKGLTYSFPLMGWVQGESDNKPTGITKEQYKSQMQVLIALVDNHLKSLNSSLGLKGLVTTQMSSFKRSGRSEPYIELALYEAAIAPNSNSYMACPLYLFNSADGFHLDGISSKIMGAYMGLVHKRVVNDGIEWKPLHPISHLKQGNILEVKFHVPVQPLVFDTTFIALNNNYGFQILNEDNTAINITNVKITQGDTVRFITDSVVPVGAKLRYAFTPSAYPSTTKGARGNLRDSQGDNIIFDPTGLKHPLHNWLPILEYNL